VDTPRPFARTRRREARVSRSWLLAASVVTCTEDGDEITLDSSATFYAAP
jgi:hypothetical protein